jgi:hypothetical protein
MKPVRPWMNGDPVHDLLMRLLWRRLREEPTPALCRRIAGYLHGAPVERLQPIIWERYGSILSMGMVESYAPEVAGRRLLDAMSGTRAVGVGGGR